MMKERMRKLRLFLALKIYKLWCYFYVFREYLTEKLKNNLRN